MIISFLKGILVLLAAVPFSLMACFGIPFQKHGRIVHANGKAWSKFVLWTYGIKVHLRGAEHIQSGTTYVYVANHASMFDIPAVISFIPDQIRLVVKKELTRIPLWGWAMKYGGYISIDRSNPIAAARSLEAAAEKIRDGTSVLLFAEGTRTRDGKLQPFKRGAFSLAAKAGVPVIPVVINNSFRILPKGSLRVHPQDIELVIGKPISTQDVEGKVKEVALMEQVREIIARDFVEQS